MSKIDPRLAMLMALSDASLEEADHEWHPDGAATPKFSNPLYAYLRFRPIADASVRRLDPFVSVLVNFTGGPRALRPLLDSWRCRVRSFAGEIFTALAPLRRIEHMQKERAVKFIELGRFARQHMNRTVPEIGAAAQRTADRSITGAGTIIGLIDMDGLDFYHDDFRNEDGTTRVVHLWDQRDEDRTGMRKPPEESKWRYGIEYDAAAINNDLAANRNGTSSYATVPHRPVVDPDRPNHATHTMGIAAGNGRASKEQSTAPWGKYTGVAPKASLIYVNTGVSGTEGLADLAAVADAVDYIFTRAGDTPCVVNISLGDDLGPHDGTSLVERFIDTKLDERSGRAVVIAAGNGGQTNQHTEVVIPRSGEVALSLKVGPGGWTGEAWQIWYSKDDSLDVIVTAPDGTSSKRISPTRPVATDPPPVPTPTTVVAGGAKIDVVSVFHDNRNGDNVIEMVMMRSGQGAVSVGEWTITLSRTTDWPAPVGETRVHAWIDGNTGLLRDMGPSATIRWRAGVSECSLTTPATSEMAITVGNYLVDDRDRSLSTTSSRGPTRDGRRKPELAAPGGNGIFAPEARVRAAGGPASADGYIRGIGTSVSAPHVAGLVALIFEIHAGTPLSAAETKEILKEIADGSRLAVVPDAEHGFGWGCARAPAPDV